MRKVLLINHKLFLDWYFQYENSSYTAMIILKTEGSVSLEELLAHAPYIPLNLVENKTEVDETDISIAKWEDLCINEKIIDNPHKKYRLAIDFENQYKQKQAKQKKHRNKHSKKRKKAKQDRKNGKQKIRSLYSH